MRTGTLTVLIVSGSVWVGGLATLVVIRLAALRTLGAEQNVELFRVIGGMWGRVAGAALAVAVLSGALLAGTPGSWEDWEVVCAVLVVALALVTAGGVAQARQLTRIRQRGAKDDLRRAVVAGRALRALIGLLTLTIVVVTAWGVS